METILDPNPTKARKTHRCDFCQYLINTGDTYLRSTHVAFGDIYTWKSHQQCDDIAVKLNMFEDCDEGLTSDDFIQYIFSEYDNIDGPKMPRGTEFKLTFVCHTITDYFTSRIVSKKFAEGKYGSAIPNFGAFTLIGGDQVLHYIQLFATYYYLIKI